MRQFIHSEDMQMARKTKEQLDAEKAAETQAAADAEAEGTYVEGIEGTEVDTEAEGAEAAVEGAEAAVEGAEAAVEGAEAATEATEIDAETWASMTPQEKLAHQKEKARKAASRTSSRVGTRRASGEETIGSVACDAIREGLTNDEVLIRVFERFPAAKTSVASVTWYRNSLKASGEKVKSSREIVAARNKARADAGEGADGTTAAPETGISAEDQAALDALNDEGDISGEDLEGLLA